jgi:hypothetical protein
MTSINLPDLNLKFERRTSDSNNSTNSNSNTLSTNISNNIVLNNVQPENINIIEPKVNNLNTTNISDKIDNSNTPDNIKIFKEYLLSTLISYFKSEIILANNIIEISPNIVLKINDLKKLISILVCDSDESRVFITNNPLEFGGCKFTSCCAKFPLYQKIEEIIIDKKFGFKVYFNTFYNQMINNFNISLDYVLN